ncbi:hypothetical protein GHT09_005096 [Marmota monax]|uniref:Uncharacterized protein n=1 Tax=Marmota monax TaxID=9995 RepID=A0A834PYB9_MARMO|nr:hypothetical protein GHT09_005096 [Marmota monax]
MSQFLHKRILHLAPRRRHTPSPGVQPPWEITQAQSTEGISVTATSFLAAYSEKKGTKGFKRESTSLKFIRRGFRRPCDSLHEREDRSANHWHSKGATEYGELKCSLGGN